MDVVGAVARSLARRMREAKPPTGQQQVLRYRNCVVASVGAAGSAADGGAAVFIKVGADTIPATCLNSVPANGSTVAVLFVNGSPIVLGKPVSTPNLA